MWAKVGMTIFTGMPNIGSTTVNVTPSKKEVTSMARQSKYEFILALFVYSIFVLSIFVL